jgi:hypothetical protein
MNNKKRGVALCTPPFFVVLRSPFAEPLADKFALTFNYEERKGGAEQKAKFLRTKTAEEKNLLRFFCTLVQGRFALVLPLTSVL